MKVHVEIAATNWKRLEAYQDAYNHSTGRLTPKVKLADVVNLALLEYLEARGIPLPGEGDRG